MTVTYLVSLSIVHVQIHYILATETDEVVENLTRGDDASLDSPFRPEAPHWMHVVEGYPVRKTE